MNAVIIQTTCCSKVEAKNIAKVLIEEKYEKFINKEHKLN